MAKEQFTKFFYIGRLSFLGFRYHGWQKQTTGHKTIQEMVNKTFIFLFGEDMIKTMAASRTDAMVSADDFVFKLTSKIVIPTDGLIKLVNENLPQDIRLLSFQRTDTDMNIIGMPKVKTYRYFFAYGEQSYPPLISSFMSIFKENLNLELMKECAKLFVGEHDFQRYCYKPNPDKQFKREIIDSVVRENDQLTGSFIPKSFYFEISSAGFMRHQVRIMMGALVLVGSGKWSLEQVQESLKGENFDRVPLIAPASGLRLHQTKMLTLE